MTPLELGRIVATPSAIAELQRAGVDPAFLLRKHENGDWGTLTASDRRANELALRDGSRVFSSYILETTGAKVWCITEAVGDDGHRASTCLLLPADY